MDNVTMEQEEQIQVYMEKYDISAKYAKRFIAMEEQGVTTNRSKIIIPSKKMNKSCGFKYKPFNGWAFFFGPFWYFFHKMWKRGLIWLILFILFGIMMDIILALFLNVEHLQNIKYSYITGYFSGLFANYDYYCYKVKKQTGWGLLDYQFFK